MKFYKKGIADNILKRKSEGKGARFIYGPKCSDRTTI